MSLVVGQTFQSVLTPKALKKVAGGKRVSRATPGPRSKKSLRTRSVRLLRAQTSVYTGSDCEAGLITALRYIAARFARICNPVLLQPLDGNPFKLSRAKFKPHFSQAENVQGVAKAPKRTAPPNSVQQVVTQFRIFQRAAKLRSEERRVGKECRL